LISPFAFGEDVIVGEQLLELAALGIKERLEVGLVRSHHVVKE
jgi:hypothetical protein